VGRRKNIPRLRTQTYLSLYQLLFSLVNLVQTLEASMLTQNWEDLFFPSKLLNKIEMPVASTLATLHRRYYYLFGFVFP